ncbi:transcriptional regulator SlyA [compost metagenome]
MGKAALGGLIDRLEVIEVIQRRPDTSDRRVKRIFLTTKGNQTVKEMRERSHDMSEQILVGLTEDQRLALADMLTLVKQNLKTIKRENGIED